MSQLMCQHLHVTDCLVEAGKYKRCAVPWQLRHIACGSLSSLVFQVHQLMPYHEVNKFPCLRAHFMVHFCRLAYHEIIIACRNGIAIRKNTFLVINGKIIHTKTLCLCLIQFLADWHNHCAHLFAERLDFLLAVIRAPLLHVAYRYIIFVPEIASHLVSDANQLIPDFLQARLMLVIKFRIGACRRFAHLSVLMLKVLLHAVQVQCFPIKSNLRSRHNFLVLIRKLCLLLHQRNIFLTE